jgi:hypothetical protein
MFRGTGLCLPADAGISFDGGFNFDGGFSFDARFGGG